MNPLDLEDGAEQADSLILSSQESATRSPKSFSDRSRPLMSQRLRAVRPEAINFLSFFSTVWKLHDEEKASVWKSLFFISGIFIMIIDLYFMYCEWQLRSNRAISIPFLQNSKRHMIGALDDLLSDLPQSIWVLLYIFTFRFSVITLVCAVHSAFSLVENMVRLVDTD